jgi:4-hydroxyphenylpyruvate dioxygenase
MVCSNVSPESLGGIDRAAADLHEIGDRAAKRGMRVAFEALSWGRHIHEYRDAWEAVRRADHPVVGLVLDSFHILARRTDLGGIRAIPRDRIFLVQMADAPLLQMDYLSWSRHYRNFPGQGDLPINDFMKALLSTGYDGLLSLEIFNDQFRAGSARSVAVDGHRSLIYILDQLQQEDHRGRRLQPRSARSRCPERSSSNSRSTRVIDKNTPSPRSPYRDGIRATSTSWSTPRRKASRILQYRSRYVVCAIALKVEDASATLGRAQDLLLEQPFWQAVGPGELDIGRARRGRKPRLLTDPERARARLGHRFRAARWPEPSRRRRPHGHRSHLAIHALPGNAYLAALLQITSRC